MGVGTGGIDVLEESDVPCPHSCSFDERMENMVLREWELDYSCNLRIVRIFRVVVTDLYRARPVAFPNGLLSVDPLRTCQ